MLPKWGMKIWRRVERDFCRTMMAGKFWPTIKNKQS
jgi:hypothetical protein